MTHEVPLRFKNPIVNSISARYITQEKADEIALWLLDKWQGISVKVEFMSFPIAYFTNLPDGERSLGKASKNAFLKHHIVEFLHHELGYHNDIPSAVNRICKYIDMRIEHNLNAVWLTDLVYISDELLKQIKYEYNEDYFRR